jgi:chorismate-pyruvate lyase
VLWDCEMRFPASLALLVALTAPPPTAARTPSPARIESTELNRRLLASPSATATLRQWCAEHGIADPVIHAEVMKVAPPAATAAQRRELQVAPREPLGYRRVRLGCAGHVLSEAENWYVPSRLTREMNATLDSGDTPFGTVVAPLRISRRNLAAVMLWRHGAKPPAQLFRHRALVLDAAGRPIAEVIETYQREAVALR